MAEGLFDLVLAGLLLMLAGGALYGRSLYTSILLFVTFGLVLALVWARLGAVDLALAEAAIGAGLTGALLFAALARQGRAPEGEFDLACRRRGLAAAAVLLPVLWLMLSSLAPLAERDSPLPELALAALPHSGVEHPVTAVLLNYRAWDTLLELAVLLLALLGARQLGSGRLDTARPWPQLRAWNAHLAPLLVLVGGFLLWRGSSAPGGAFQAGALLAAGVVSLRLAHLLPPLRWSFWPLRLLVLLGLALFLAVAAAGAWLGQGWLSYPAGWAKPLILAIEVAATLSIAASLSLLVVGERREPAP
ncbi:hydrogenase subunit MbhD domain-containing protein [Stutzerimonas azotifigens]|uniref:hydrogenase subunit MbhD domain-containing protein n=1 Tax=Stutzerimonas azotifigens TaxID=291995 RepID=UPI0004204E0F|nr:hydrogenase subunit MbhD domain-containing protein [Stutzerimonas azotifigens]